MDIGSYFNPVTFIHTQKTKIILPAKISMLDETKGSYVRDHMVFLFFPACVGPYTKWSLVFSERQAVAIYRYAAEKARIVTYLVPSNGHIKGIWWEDLQAMKKQFRNFFKCTYYWSFQVFFCPQLTARGFEKQLHKTITMILIRSESSLQYANT